MGYWYLSKLVLCKLLTKFCWITVDNLQVELQNLAASIQNLATDTAVVGSVELAELQVLIDASNKQEGDIGKLIYSNGIWQQNFRVINSTFERLRKVVVFPIPTINNPSVQASTVRRIIPSIQGRKNLTILKIPVTPKKKLNSRIKS